MTDKDIEVKDIYERRLRELDDLFLNEKKLGDPLIIEGTMMWKSWMKNNLERYDSIGKIAYSDSKIIGIIQYIPKLKEKVAEIKWSFVDDEKEGEAVKDALLKETIKEFRGPKSCFENEETKGLVTYFNSFRKSYDDEKFYSKNGFRPLSEEDSDLLYYPLKEDSISVPDSAKLPIDESKRDGVIVLCNPINPYCLKEALKTMREVRRLDERLSTKLFAPVDESEELNHAFSIPISLVVNNKLLDFSHVDGEGFLGGSRSADHPVKFVETSSDGNKPLSENRVGDNELSLLYT